jgi:hypothetical protein
MAHGLFVISRVAAGVALTKRSKELMKIATFLTPLVARMGDRTDRLDVLPLG